MYSLLVESWRVTCKGDSHRTGSYFHILPLGGGNLDIRRFGYSTSCCSSSQTVNSPSSFLISIINMRSTSYITALAGLARFSYAAVPPIFDSELVNDVLIALRPELSIPPLSTRFGGCDANQVATIERAWNEVMSSVIPDAINALQATPGTVSQIDNIFNAIFGASESRSGVRG
jgi:hypothetical protein